MESFPLVDISKSPMGNSSNIQTILTKHSSTTSQNEKENFFATFHRDSAILKTAISLPNEPEEYKFINGVLLPPTPNFPPLTISSQRSSRGGSQNSTISSNSAGSGSSASTQTQQSTVANESQISSENQPLILSPPSPERPKSLKLLISAYNRGITMIRLATEQEENKENSTSGASKNVTKIIKPPQSAVDGKPGRMNVDRYVKFFLKENRIDAGVNILRYEDVYGGRHKASLLPNGYVQANMKGAPVFLRIHDWIRHVNNVPKSRQPTVVANESKRIKYHGSSFASLIRDYEENVNREEDPMEMVQ